MKRSLACVPLIAALLCALLCSCSGGKDAETTTVISESGIENTFGNYKYKLLSDGSAKITKYIGTEEQTELFIPDYLNGTKVSVIGADSFTGVSGISIINMPSTVTTVEDRAFAGCSAIKVFLHKSSVTAIGKEAFSGCANLIQADLPRTLESIGEKAFSGCKSLVLVTFRCDVAAIADTAFDGCSSFTASGADSFSCVKAYCEKHSVKFSVSSAVAARTEASAKDE